MTVEKISRFPSAPKRVADDDRVIAEAKKGAPTSWCALYSLFMVASLSLKKYGWGESATAPFGMDAQNAVDV